MTLTHTLTDGRTVQLTPRGSAGFAVSVVAADGAIVWCDAPLDLAKAAHRTRIIDGGKMSGDDVMAVAAMARGGAPAQKDKEPDAKIRLMLRGLRESPAKAVPITADSPTEALAAALKAEALPAEALIYWDEAIDLRCVDVDWHGDAAAPRSDELERLAINTRPSPAFWWVTHGGGLRLCYPGAGGYSGEELASCAAAHVLGLRPEATVEVKADTRHPASLRDGKRAGPVQECLPDTVLAVLGRFSKRGCTEAARDEWLANQGMHLGGKFAHHFCPIDAGHVSKSPNPVWAGEEGIYCQSCASRTDGFRSYGRLTGAVADTDNPIYLAAKHLVHWNQADYYFAASAAELPVCLRRPIYSALVKSMHGKEPGPDRIDRVFADFGFVRGGGIWLVADTLQPAAPRLQKEDVARLAYSLRWVKDDNGADVAKASAEMTLKLASNVPLPGLPPLVALPSCPIYGVHNVTPTVGGLVPVLPHSKRLQRQCRYIKRKDRLPLEDAWKAIERYFPGISHEYLTLLHVARGYGEMGIGSLPIVYAQGPSGASKTTTSMIESSMSGDVYKELGMGEWSKVSEAVGDAAAEAGAMTVNEFAKLNAKAHGAAATWALQMGRSHTYRKMYVGNITIPVRCYVLLTDTRLPYEIVSNEQFGRRVVYVRLRSPVQWGGAGVTAENWLEAPGSQAAADTLHSWIVDEFFPAGHKSTFQDAALKLGFRTIENHFNESEDGLRRKQLAVNLFTEICKAPSYGDRGMGRGWVAAGVDSEENPVGAVLREMLAQAGEESSTPEAINAALEPLYGKWQKVLGLSEPARLEIRKDRSKVSIRFISDDDRVRYLTNGELVIGYGKLDESA